MSLAVEIRMYDPSGARWPLPDKFVGPWDFEVDERSGYATFKLALIAELDDAQIPALPDANWRFDWWFNGIPAFRGWVEQPRPAIHEGAPSFEISGTGRSGRLAQILVNCEFAKPYGADISEIYAWIANNFLTPIGDGANRFGTIAQFVQSIQPSIGVTVERMAFFGKNCRQAYDDAAQAAGNRLIWGIDFIPSGQDRLYVKSRATAVTDSDYIFRVGKDVDYIDQPTDLSTVINAIRLKCGPAQVPNLVYNPSFELPALPGEGQAGNLLTDPSFELGTSAGATPPGWTFSSGGNGASRKQSDFSSGKYARTGQWFAEIDNPGEYIEQIVTLPAAVPIGTPFVFVFSYVNVNPNSAPAIFAQLDSLNASGAELELLAYNQFNATGRTYQQWPAAGATQFKTTVAGCDKLKVHIGYTSNPMGIANDAALIDDVFLYRGDALAQDGWEAVDFGTGLATMSWAMISPTTPAWHGIYYVNANVTGVDGTNTNVVWMRPTQDHWISARTRTNYRVRVRVRGAAGLGYRLGLDVQEKNKSTFQVFSAAGVLSGGGWQTLDAVLSVDSSTVSIRPILEFRSAGSYDVDAWQVYEDGIATIDPSQFWDGANLHFYLRGDNAAPATPLTLQPADPNGLSTAAQGSIAAWGLREAEVTIESITDIAQALAYGAGYLNEFAQPLKQGRLVIDPATVHVRFVDETDQANTQGQISVGGARTAIAPQNAARILYYGDANGKVRCEIELTNRRPDPALLLLGLLGKGSSGGGGGGGGGYTASNLIATPGNSVPGGNTSAAFSVQTATAGDTGTFDADVQLRTGGTAANYNLTLAKPIASGSPILVMREQVYLVSGVGYTTTVNGNGLTVIAFADGQKPIAGETVTIYGVW